MTTITMFKKSTATPKAVWDLLSDFANIDFFNPNLSRSFLLSDKDQPAGVGTKRQCDLADGKNYIQEEVLEWKQGEYYVIDIFNGTLPVKNAKTKLGVMPTATGGSRVYMEFSYTPPLGILGPVLDLLVLKSYLSKTLQKVVDGLADKAENAPAGKLAFAAA